MTKEKEFELPKEKIKEIKDDLEIKYKGKDLTSLVSAIVFKDCYVDEYCDECPARNAFIEIRDKLVLKGL